MTSDSSLSLFHQRRLYQPLKEKYAVIIGSKQAAYHGGARCGRLSQKCGPIPRVWHHCRAIGFQYNEQSYKNLRPTRRTRIRRFGYHSDLGNHQDGRSELGQQREGRGAF